MDNRRSLRFFDSSAKSNNKRNKEFIKINLKRNEKWLPRRKWVLRGLRDRRGDEGTSGTAVDRGGEEQKSENEE